MGAQRTTPARAAVVERLVDAIDAFDRRQPTRVAVDGPDAAGKTTLADEIAAGLAQRGRPTIRASMDGFHRPRAERYRRGPESPAGCYEDSFDLDAVRRELLDALGPGGDRVYRTATFDHRADRPATASPQSAPSDAVLVFDGVFLFRPELLARWELRIFVAVDVEETLRRALERDTPLFGSPEEVARRYRRRYIPAQRIYVEAVRPEMLADAVVRNDDPGAPVLERVRSDVNRETDRPAR